MKKIIYINDYKKAKDYKEFRKIDATVEAEYGDFYIEGDVITLAHHVEKFKNNPAPCEVSVDKDTISKVNTIMISHIDLDTIGGCLELMDMKPEYPEFWEGAAFIDINGPHRIHELPEKIKDYLNGWYAWKQTNPTLFNVEEGQDVYDLMIKYREVLNAILSDDGNLINSGREHSKNHRVEENKRLIEETPFYRIFMTHDYFTAASYYSEKYNKVVRCTITYNTNSNSITLAFSDNEFNAREIVQKLWGNEAGGHDHIAGSPRGKAMTLSDLNDIVTYIQKLESNF